MNEHLHLRVSPDIKQRVIAAARAARRTPSDFVRLTLEAAVGEPVPLVRPPEQKVAANG